ncbi:F-box/LRR-repeat protein At2g43260-like [Aegilops tauschii subsp. strangulata]|uniref:Uncharacterized protein n=1 Tax=Aegilops tauschii TaxID=37682 RepID=M8CUI8_AEGTA|nr:F-box/LRR-repeat protein At2g43260-like [Aegilops tauschii subsp. strangulata]
MAVRRDADVPVSSRPRKMMTIIARSLAPYLPDALIFSILSRLPSKSAIRCKSVCKAWHAMISDCHFVNHHLELSKAACQSMLVLPLSYCRAAAHEGLVSFWMDFYTSGAGNVAAELIYSEHIPQGIGRCAQPVHCDGLILVPTLRQEYIICNPATREFVTLPKGSHNHNEKHHRIGFGFDPSSDRYKVARFFYQPKKDGTSETICRFEVLTLGTHEWRQTVDPPYPLMGVTPAHVRGAIYWMVNLPCVGEHPNVFIRFDLSNEEFTLTPCPPCERTEPTYFIELEGQLCCACFTKKRFIETRDIVEIWICNQTEPPTWTRRCTIPISKDWIVPYPTGGFKLPKVMFWEKDLLLVCDYKAYRFCVQTGQIKEVAGALKNRQYYDPRNNSYTMFLGKDVDFYIANYAESLV